MGESHVLYEVNARDELSWVGGAWERFALENGGDHLLPQHVLGRPLWDFIGDPTTRHLYKEAFVLVRAGREVRFPFRCDGPGRRRQMLLTMTHAGGGAVRLHSATLWQQERGLVQLLDPRVLRLGDPLRVCAWCKRFKVEDGWVEAEEAVARLGLFELPAPPPLTHGICEPCLGSALAAL